MKVMCVGEMLIDFTPGSEPDSYVANPGGAPANVAVSIARNGGTAGFLGKLGADAFGERLVRTLEQERVEVLCPELTGQAVTTLAFVSLDAAGDRSFTFARKPGADLLLCREDVEKVSFADYDLVHAGSVSQSGLPERDAVLYALETAAAAGKLVSFDINYRETIWSEEACKKEVDRIFPLVDLLKISEEETGFVGGEANIAAFMKEKRIAVVVETLGAKGSRIYWQDQEFEIAGKKVKVADTTGAGDSFWGAFLFRLLEKGVKTTADLTAERLKDAGEYATVSSAICVQRHGGIPALAYRDEILAKLQEEKHRNP